MHYVYLMESTGVPSSSVRPSPNRAHEVTPGQPNAAGFPISSSTIAPTGRTKTARGTRPGDSIPIKKPSPEGATQPALATALWIAPSGLNVAFPINTHGFAMGCSKLRLQRAFPHPPPSLLCAFAFDSSGAFLGLTAPTSARGSGGSDRSGAPAVCRRQAC